MNTLHVKVMKKQWLLLRLAIQFFTRIPVGHIHDYSEDALNQSSRYFALVGLIVGAALALVFSLLNLWWSIEVSLVLTLIVSAMLTGAFHEDGLADMADGIGGGYTVERRLSIMKDSRIGTYGTMAIVLSQALKMMLLIDIAQTQLTMVLFAFIFAHGTSRAIAASLIYDTPYVSDLDSSKSKPLAQQLTSQDLVILSITAVLPLMIMPTLASGFIFSTVVVLLIFRWVFRYWIIKRLSGFTGDCLGGAQQIAEILVYLMIAAHLIRGAS